MLQLGDLGTVQRAAVGVAVAMEERTRTAGMAGAAFKNSGQGGGGLAFSPFDLSVIAPAPGLP